ncbi:MAG: AbrB/MazE/SpoVT family DNA-binding domain-containing protein [Candidatus Omnitrophica bacterium]|nr:AbrB/MazE/SpoVT family DNA-binding domain-containing protein [Candidatus Omnitrophota bacterium]
MKRKGQIVIPVKLRKKVGMKEGTRIFLEEKSGDIVLHPATPEFYDKTCGILKGSGLVKALEKSRREDREREEREIEKR